MKNLRIKQMKTAVKKLTIHLLILSLLNYSPFSYSADEEEKSLDQSNAGLGVAMQAFNSIMGQMGNTMSQNQGNLRAMQMIQQMQSLKPKVQPSKYFPHCKVPASIDSFPYNACPEVGTPQEAQVLAQYEQLTETYILNYERLMARGQDSPYSVGMQCIDEAKNHHLGELQNKINRLTQIQTEVNKRMQDFRDQNQALKDQMNSVNSELTGKGTNAQDQERANKIADYFKDPACSEATISASMDRGLRGVKKEIQDNLSKPANNLLRNKDKIKSKINASLGKLSNYINKHGKNPPNPTILFPANIPGNSQLIRIAQTQQKIIDGEIARVNSEIKGLGFKSSAIPSKIDYGFKGELDNFNAKAIKNDIINKCMRHVGPDALGMNPSVMLKSIKLGRSRKGTTVSSYENQLRVILSEPGNLQEKISKIQRLDKKFRNKLKIKINSAELGYPEVTPSQYYQEAKNRCATQYNNNYAKRVKSLTKSVSEMKSIYGQFMNNITSSVNEEVLNCSSGSSSLAGNCNKDLLSTNNPQFCLNSAVTCAKNVNQCMNKIKGYIRERETQIDVLKAQYNSNVKQFVSQQEFYLKQIKGEVMANMSWFQKYFPSADINLAKNLFVSMPKEKLDPQLGIKLLDMKDLTKLEGNNFDTKIDGLKQMLGEQKKKIGDEIGKYITAKENTIKDNKTKYIRLKKTCAKSLANYNKGAAAKAANDKKMADESNQAVYDFCFNYDRLTDDNTTTPSAYCDGDYSPAKLQEDSVAIAVRINPDALSYLRKLESQCASVDPDSEKKKTDEKDLKRLCNEKDTWGNVKKHLIAKYEKAGEEQKKNSKNYLDSIKKVDPDKEKEGVIANIDKKISDIVDAKEKTTKKLNYCTNDNYKTLHLSDEKVKQINGLCGMKESLDDNSDYCDLYKYEQFTKRFGGECAENPKYFKVDCFIEEVEESDRLTGKAKSINNDITGLLIQVDKVFITKLGQKNTPYCHASMGDGRFDNDVFGLNDDYRQLDDLYRRTEKK